MSTNAIGNGAKVFGQMGGKLYLLILGEELNVWEKRLNMGDSFHSSIKIESHTSWSGTRDDSPYFTFGFAFLELLNLTCLFYWGLQHILDPHSLKTHFVLGS